MTDSVNQASDKGANRSFKIGPGRQFGRRFAGNPALFAACLTLVLAGAAQATEIVDQQNLPPTDGSFTIQSFEQIGQEFVPDFSELVSVVLFLRENFQFSSSSNITLNIREDTIFGSIVGTLTQDPYPLTEADGSVSFDFASSIFLTPGETYVLETLADSSLGSWRYTEGNPYSDGQIYLDGVLGVAPDLDMAFQTIANNAVPEPATAAMLALGLLVLARHRRRA